MYYVKSNEASPQVRTQPLPSLHDQITRSVIMTPTASLVSQTRRAKPRIVRVPRIRPRRLQSGDPRFAAREARSAVAQLRLVHIASLVHRHFNPRDMTIATLDVVVNPTNRPLPLDGSTLQMDPPGGGREGGRSIAGRHTRGSRRNPMSLRFTCACRRSGR